MQIQRSHTVRVLVVYYTQTKNTELVAKGIYEEVMSLDHDVELMKLNSIEPGFLDGFDLVFIGSACHDADLAKPVLRFLEELSPSPSFKMAGFVTHSAYKAEWGKRREELYERWAGKCEPSFIGPCNDKNIDFLGYFHCLGAPIPEVADFIRREIIHDEDEWIEYINEVQSHPNAADIQDAKDFAAKMVNKYE